MHVPNYPVTLPNNVQIIGETECGGYLIKYKDKDDRSAIIWLPDESPVPCRNNLQAFEAIETAKAFIHSLKK